MNTFLSFAQQALELSDQPFHYKELTLRAIKLGLKTDGTTPWATMNAKISMDMKKNGGNSIFYRSEPGFYGLRKKGIQKTNRVKAKMINNQIDVTVVTNKVKAKTTGHRITTSLNTKQKGDIAEARVAELITLYGDEGLSCYRPISDDEGIDILVKKRGTTDVAYVQVKSTFGDGSRGFVSTVKEKNVMSKRRMLMVFVYFDLTEGDIHEHVFCIPGPDFLKLTVNNRKKSMKTRTFTVGLKKPDQSKYAPHLIEKRELANKILEILNET